HWDPRLPDYPGEFSGYQTHSHAYTDPFEPHDYRGKRVMVVGGGNSAMDVSSELAIRSITERLFSSMRRGVWVLSKYANGQPADKAAMPAWMPQKLGRKIAQRMIKKRLGRMEDYGLPKPDHEPLEGHPTVSEEFLARVGSGDILPKGAIERLDGDGVIFADGSREELDAIIWATGYKISFPFFSDPALTPGEDNAFPLFKRMVKPGYDNLFFLGLAQPLPTLVNFAEQQSKLVAAALTGDYALPGEQEMARAIAEDEKLYLSHFYESKRHTIQVDFGTYVRDLMKEMARGSKHRRWML
ncbi:MAG: NAD(P)-binding domain-containing protein, partial [Sphingomonadaceae bacterium]|nr:NAD(P)-binding domain-containing protein [Sphingomonadaceae bacterium]